MDSKTISVRIEEELWERLRVVAYCERRCISKQAALLIEQGVIEYEIAHGKLRKDKP